MKEHKGVISLLKQAEAKQRCALSSSSSALYHALRRRVKSCELISPYPTLFARTDYWTQLNAEEQSLHMIRALATLHPQWTFAGLSAACVYGYQHAYSLHDGSVHIAGNSGITGRDHSKLNRIYMPRIPLWKCQGILVTSPARTLVDCSTFSFSSALAIYDSALCSGHVTVEEINTLAIQTNCDEAAVANYCVTLILQAKMVENHSLVVKLSFAILPCRCCRWNSKTPTIPQLHIELISVGNLPMDASSWPNMTVWRNMPIPPIKAELLFRQRWSTSVVGNTI